eukprot:1150049-Pelagomonas_calceolata.AAC.7
MDEHPSTGAGRALALSNKRAAGSASPPPNDVARVSIATCWQGAEQQSTGAFKQKSSSKCVSPL